MRNPKMKLPGFNIDIINKTTAKNRSVFSTKTKIFCEPTELCIILFDIIQNSSGIRLVQLNFRLDNLDIYTAYDIAIGIEECKKQGIQFIGFSEQLSMSHMLALCFCDFRICPPLVGPLFFSLNFKHFVLNKGGKYFQSVKIGEKKLPLINVLNEKLNETALKEERELGDDIILKCINIILLAIPQKNSLKNYYSTAVELTENNLLTHVCYEEYILQNIPTLNKIKWKYKFIHKVNLISYFSKVKQRLNRNFYILEIKSSYWDELNSLNELRRQLSILYNSKTTKGLLLIVNHKGGSYESADRIWCLINLLKKKIPVYVYIKVAASSGYCIASTGDEIFINPCGYLGNVGTILFSANHDSILNQFGIEVINNISSPLKKDPIDSDNLIDKARIAFTLFINRIAESRKLEIETVSNLMDGSNFNSNESVLNKFADSEETLISVLSKIRFAKNFNFVFVKESETFFSRFLNKLLLSTMHNY